MVDGGSTGLHNAPMIRTASNGSLLQLMTLLLACVILSACGSVDFADPLGRSSRPIDSGRQISQSGTVIVQGGDTVYGIARRIGVPVRALIEANRLSPPYRLYIGRKLYVPRVTTHKVAKGESLYSLGKMYDISIYDLARENGLRPPYTLYVGQILNLPGDSAGIVQGEAVKRPTETGRTLSVTKASTATSRAIVSAPPPAAGKGFAWPLKGKVVSRFGTKANGLHNDGINIVAPRGTAVRAAQNGVVAYAGNELKGFGNLLLVKHSNGWITAYAHNDVLLVKRGDKVRKGQTISKVGSSGNVSSPQLHFEIRKGKRAIDPFQKLI